jgi:DNA repair protein RadC
MHEVIADLPLDDRPREKLRKHGAETLSDAELVAILLGSGTRGKNAIQLARELLREGLVAAFEVARRLAGANANDGARYDDAIVARSLISRYAHEVQEHLGAVFLDSRQRVLRQSEIYVGTVSRAIVSTRDIVRSALEANACAVVLFHNHPSGDPSPSAEDLTFTKRVQQSLALVDVELVDHLVIGSQRYCSMKVRGLI